MGTGTLVWYGGEVGEPMWYGEVGHRYSIREHATVCGMCNSIGTVQWGVPCGIQPGERVWLGS